MIADQEIRYCTTADGVKIAYATSGEGPPLLYLTPTVGHLLADWEFPHFRRRYEWLGRMFTVYRFDVRGTGLSQRESFGSVDYLADLKAVVDDSGLLSFVVIADGPAGPRAMPFLVEHGARLSRLLLLNSFASYPEIYGDARFGALIQLLRADWTMFTETISRLVGNWSTDDDAKDYAALMRRSATPESYRLAKRRRSNWT